MAEKGWSLPDGRYPIFDIESLRRALWAFRNSRREDREIIKSHIEKRATDLGLESLLPQVWVGQGSYFSEEETSFSMREKAQIQGVLLATGGIPYPFEEEDKIFESLFQGDIIPEELFPEGIADVSLDFGEDEEPVYDQLDYDYDMDDTELATKEPTKDMSPEEIEALEDEKLNGEKSEGLKVNRQGKYTADTQPRDAQGKFRKVLARLKIDLGTAGADRALRKVEEVENLDFSGDYGRAAKAAGDLIGIIDRLDTKALNPESLENVRASSAELGKVIANLPFAFGEEAQKIRFSDVPPALRDLMEDMITKVEAKIGKEDADAATAELRSFISGSEVYSQSEISGQMAKLLRLLT